MHEAIYDLLPEEQTQVNVIFELHLTAHLEMHMDFWEQERLYLGRGEFFFESWWNPHIKGLGSSHTDSLGWAEGSIPVCRESNEAHKKNGFQDFELPFNV